MLNYIQPQWPVPASVKSLITTRIGDGELGFNLAAHVDDQPESVEKNREKLTAHCVDEYGYSPSFQWLKQVHSSAVVECPQSNADLDSKVGDPEADASFTTKTHQACAVLTADCLPLLLCNRQGSEVAAIHAGWRGLVNGVISNTVSRLSSSSDELMVYLGPAISQTAFEVGSEVIEVFMKNASRFGGPSRIDNAVIANPRAANKYFLDLVALAKSELLQLGVTRIYGGSYCTVENNDLFFSYRKERQTGRFLSAIWIDAQ